MAIVRGRGGGPPCQQELGIGSWFPGVGAAGATVPAGSWTSWMQAAAPATSSGGTIPARWSSSPRGSAAPPCTIGTRGVECGAGAALLPWRPSADAHLVTSLSPMDTDQAHPARVGRDEGDRHHLGRGRLGHRIDGGHGPVARRRGADGGKDRGGRLPAAPPTPGREASPAAVTPKGRHGAHEDCRRRSIAHCRPPQRTRVHLVGTRTQILDPRSWTTDARPGGHGPSVGPLRLRSMADSRGEWWY